MFKLNQNWSLKLKAMLKIFKVMISLNGHKQNEKYIYFPKS